MKTLNYTQSTPSATWTITHNFGTQAISIDVVDTTSSDHEVILPRNIETPDVNTVVISFTSARTGTCRVVAPLEP